MSERGSPSRSRSRSPAEFAGSRSRSASPRGGGRDSRSRSRSEPSRRDNRSGSNDRPKRRESRSPMSDRRRHQGDREEPEPNKCLGVFGLSLYTTERELEKEFGRFGILEKTQVVLDGHSGRSRGFAFVYFESIKDASAAREAMNGLDLDGRKIRVDYSITKRPHTPTPGMYMGRPTDAKGYSSSDRGDRGGRGRGRGRGGGRGDWRGGPPSRHYDDHRGPPPRHYDDRGPPPRSYDDRGSDRYHGGGADRYGGPPPRHYDDRGPPPRHYEDRGYGGSSRHYEDRGYEDRGRRGGADRYGGDRYLDDRYGGPSHGTRRPRSPSPYYREQRPRRDYRSRSRSYERPRY